MFFGIVLFSFWRSPSGVIAYVCDRSSRTAVATAMAMVDTFLRMDDHGGRGFLDIIYPMRAFFDAKTTFNTLRVIYNGIPPLRHIFYLFLEYIILINPLTLHKQVTKSVKNIADYDDPNCDNTEENG